MAKPIYLQVSTPCNEKWSEMTPTQQGAFCKSCNKNVIDFTRKTENEIHHIVTQTGGELCGRFTQFQINQPIRKTEVRNGFFNWRAIAASLATLLASGKVAVGQNDTISNYFSCTGNMTSTSSNFNSTVAGEVRDVTTKELIISATVKLTNANTGVLTDFDGRFDLAIAAQQYIHDTIEIKDPGYFTKSITVSELISNPIIYLEPTPDSIIIVTMGKVSARNPLEEEIGGYNDLTPLLHGEPKARRKKIKR